MKKLISLSIVVLCYFANINAQDIILTKNSDVISAKILEISSTEVKYKKFGNPNGPTFTLEKSDIQSITYQNGEKEVFNVSSAKKSNISVSPFINCGFEIMAFDSGGEQNWQSAVSNTPEGWRLPTQSELKCMCKYQKKNWRFFVWRILEYGAKRRFQSQNSLF
jgi:hypothetical protein